MTFAVQMPHLKTANCWDAPILTFGYQILCVFFSASNILFNVVFSTYYTDVPIWGELLDATI